MCVRGRGPKLGKVGKVSPLCARGRGPNVGKVGKPCPLLLFLPLLLLLLSREEAPCTDVALYCYSLECSCGTGWETHSEDPLK